MEFLPNTDNFFKYLLTAGLILIVFTVVYPIQEQKKVDLEVLTYQEKENILSFQIMRLNKSVSQLENNASYLQKELDSLKKAKKRVAPYVAKQIELQRVLKKRDFDATKIVLNDYADSLTLNAENLAIHKEKIFKLKSYYRIFGVFKVAFIGFGIFLITIGFRYWASSVYQDELKKGNEAGALRKSAFVRHLDWCTPGFRWIMFILLIVLLIILLFWFYRFSSTLQGQG